MTPDPRTRSTPRFRNPRPRRPRPLSSSAKTRPTSIKTVATAVSLQRVAAIRRCLVAVCSSQDMALVEEQEMDTIGDFKPLYAEDRIESDTVAIYSRAASVRTYNPRRFSDGLHSSLQRSRMNPKRDSARKTGAPPTEKDRAMPVAANQNRDGGTSAKESTANVTDSPTETSTDSPKRPHISLCQVLRLASYTYFQTE